MKSSAKRLLAVLIVLAMALSLVPMMAFAAGTTLYVQPNTNWLQSNARFAAYFFENGKSEVWVSATDADGDGVYEVEAPEGYTNVIFCRMNPNAAANNWNNKWNQTSDLKVPTDSKICYVVANNTWDKGAGQWVEYTPEGGAGETEPTTASPIKFSVAGEAGLCGSAWMPEDINNMMTDEDADGIYTITYTNVAAGSYQFKVTDGTWNNSWGGDGPDGNYLLTLTVDGDVTINFNTADNSIEVIGADPVPPVKEPLVINSVHVAGMADLTGADWDPTANQMVEENGIYVITFENVAAGTYEFKFAANGGWDINWATGEAMESGNEYTVWFNAMGNSSVVIPADGATVIMMLDLKNMDPITGEGALAALVIEGGEIPEPGPEPEPEPITGTFYVAGDFNGWNEKDEAYLMAEADGIYTITFAVAAGNHELKVTDGTWDNAWGKDGGNYGFYKAEDGEVTVTFDGTTVNVIGGDLPPVVEKDYCLVGWINGADYGCNDNWETVGEYIFVDGTLTTSFTEDSYIFVKSTDNANWYLTNAYTEETSATFVMGGSEKMKVPGGVELTFSLVVNEDGSVTVSYEVASEPVLGATVSGAVVTGAEGDVTIELIADGEVVASVTATGKEGAYSIVDVAAGTYTLKVSQANHVEREYTITVADEDLTQDVKIHLIGDIDGNGKVNTGDVAKLNAHLKGTNKLTDEYQIKCANVNGGSLNMGDTAALYGHIKGTKKLY